MNLKCDECNGEKIRFDHRGYYFCCQCGLVIKEAIVIDQSPVFINDKETGRQVMSNKALRNGTTIGRNNERDRKLKRLQKIQNNVFRKKENQSYFVFRQLMAKFDVKLDINLFSECFKKIYSKMPKYSMLKNIKLLSTVIFIKICKNNMVLVPIKDVLNFYGLTRKKYYNVVRYLKKIKIKSLDISKIHRKKFMKKLIGQAINKFNEFHHLGIDNLDYVWKTIKKFGYKLGSKPNIITGTAISLVLNQIKLENDDYSKISINKVARILNVTPSTIYNKFYELNESFEQVIKPTVEISIKKESPKNVIKIDEVKIEREEVINKDIKSKLQQTINIIFIHKDWVKWVQSVVKQNRYLLSSGSKKIFGIQSRKNKGFLTRNLKFRSPEQYFEILPKNIPPNEFKFSPPAN